MKNKVMALLLMLAGLTVPAQAQYIDFSEDNWILTDAVVTEHLGRTSLEGVAYLKDVDFTDGIIEVDIAANGKTSYPGIIFRVQSLDNCERFYIRPHRAGHYPDALQYTPTFNGVAGWQLYNGDGCTAATEFPVDQWIRVRLEIKGSQARVFIGQSDKPGLTITDLKHGQSHGTIGLFGPTGGSAFFSNFRYEITSALDFPPPPDKVTALGTVRTWQLSRSYKYSEISPEKTPEQQGLTDLQWETVEAEPSGLLDISRFRSRIEGGEVDLVWAKLLIVAEKAEMREYGLGYSDFVVAFVNGRPIFNASSDYKFRDPSFLGIVGLFDGLYLPLEPGRNEVLFLVGESFGGWGLMARDMDTMYVDAGLQKAWESGRVFKYPETVVYDSAREVAYVSNYAISGGHISRISLDGSIRELSWVTGLDRPAGLALVGDKLFAVEQNGLAEIDVTTGVVVAHYPNPEARFLNDIAACPDGRLLVSDMTTNALYVFDHGQWDSWLVNPAISRPDAMLIHEGRLLVGSANNGRIHSIMLDTKEISDMASFGMGAIIDGIKPDGNGNYLVSVNAGKIYRVTPAGEKNILLDASGPGINCANFAYIQDRRLLIIPTWTDNRVVAYSLHSSAE